ncbi:phosphonoacetaldehyde phosphonohydrolase-related protein [Pseudomonas sp. SDI]|uniref:phosphonoacetaldehyde phosphonohydrolase-related protein n=1 Tax=Pseudomonas sp. SDI TaxID=2170734 RepID=UPI000DE64D53|nr:phosphonoacetaldehyde phosphonohydrolase-related protein [Pseudomonas sp. SDI]PWB30439.1 phosphonoacetaldehyde phosphonohydrolase-related protein [Pseudomonas sp. SDI]
MPHAPAFTALLFGLRGCLVDFGARCQSPADSVSLTPGALHSLELLNRQGVPCAWLDDLPEPLGRHLALPLPDWLDGIACSSAAPWPAPDACWQALMQLKASRLDGCVLVSGEPQLLQSGLNAGLWTIGLAACGPLCGLSTSQWQALGAGEREQKRGQATLALFKLGVHSVIDHLEELHDCLNDIAQRRHKGEKP